MKQLILLLALLVWEVHCDCVNPDTANFESNCRTNSLLAPDHILPTDWGLMLDSYDFSNLIEGSSPAWKRTPGTEQWVQRGGVCQYAPRACSFAAGEPQNNWLFTNYITFPVSSQVDEVAEVYFNITFRFSLCLSNPACTNAFVTVYKFDSATAASVEAQTNPSNYQPLRGSGSEIDSRLVQTGELDVNINWPLPKSLFSSSGFYLGFRDTGTCGTIRRIYVYYKKAPTYNGILLTCPNVPLPPVGNSVTTRGTCCCGDKTMNASTLERVCSTDGSCVEPSDDVCGCQPGYEFDGTQCVACPEEMFQPEISRVSMCVACPANSLALFPATPVCECVPPTIRNINRPRDPCAEPPSPPLLTSKPVVDGTVVRVCWGEAIDSGGLNDLHYNIYTRRPDMDSSVYRKLNTVGVTSTNGSPSDICYEAAGLDPMSSYAIVVTSANGATGDPDSLNSTLASVDGQYVAFFVDTGEAGLRKSGAIAVTFFVTLIAVALVTGIVVFLIMYFVCVQGKVHHSPQSSVSVPHKDTSREEFYSEDVKHTTRPPQRPVAPPRPLKPKM